MFDQDLGLQPHADEPSLPSTRRRWCDLLLAFVFSFPVPGSGQVYARNSYRGLILGVSLFLGTLLLGVLHAPKTPQGFAVYILWTFGFGLFIVVDAARSGWNRAKRKKSAGPAAFGTSIIVVTLAACAIFQGTEWFRSHFFQVKAFKVPSNSMCPTICEGDRIIVDRLAFQTQEPRRGDVIAFAPRFGGSPYLKRVIGIAGDVVQPGSGNTILVNGSVIRRPEICGRPPVAPGQSVGLDFPETRVPGGSFFVVGDNLGNSFDSRMEEFGLVKPQQVIGRPLFLYWSFDEGRIGCRIH